MTARILVSHPLVRFLVPPPLVPPRRPPLVPPGTTNPSTLVPWGPPKLSSHPPHALVQCKSLVLCGSLPKAIRTSVKKIQKMQNKTAKCRNDQTPNIFHVGLVLSCCVVGVAIGLTAAVLVGQARRRPNVDTLLCPATALSCSFP